MRFENEYRCSCCNTLKSKTDQNFVPWDLDAPEDEQTEVAICGECFAAMQAGGCQDIAAYRVVGGTRFSLAM